jgi:peptidoglycan/LPS O-acetylase OafA/YrhL
VLVLWALSIANWMGLNYLARFGLDADYRNLSELLPYFLGGAIAYYGVRRFGISAAAGAGATMVSAALLVFVPSWGGQLAAPAIGYALLWLSTLVPQPGFITRNDVSYGFYIYAWPIQQLIALVGGYRLGMWFFWLTSIIGTLILALGSWLLIERPALNAARGRTKAARRRAVSEVAAESTIENARGVGQNESARASQTQQPPDLIQPSQADRHDSQPFISGAASESWGTERNS